MIPSPLTGQRILSFNDPYHDSSFHFLIDGQERHVESERFTRRKYDGINPVVAFCEMHPELVDRFDHVGVSTNFALAQFMFAVAGAKESGSRDANLLATELPIADPDLVARGDYDPSRANSPATRAFIRHLLKPETRLYFCGHHACHAANAFISSGMDSALSVTLDGGGVDFLPLAGGRNVLTTGDIVGQRPPRRLIYGSVYACSAGRITLVDQLTSYSIGGMWGLIGTRVMGLKDGEEGTVMAMAALGDPHRYLRELEQSCLAAYTADWLSEPARSAALWTYLDALVRRTPREQDKYDLAAALQAFSERRIRDFLARHVKPAHRNLCVSGGVFLNCQATGKIREWFPWLERIYVPPAPYDGGLSIGVTQLVLSEIMGIHAGPPRGRMSPYAMGETYSRSAILDALDRKGMPWTTATADDLFSLLIDGRVVALFQGSSESGRRALGNRSIVAHPGYPGLKDHINAIVKHRQWFRPFAPMVLADQVADWFTCEPGFESPYMSFAIPVRAERRETIANVVHADGSARVQTVHPELNAPLHALLSGWHRRTGIPVWLNTSFNDREPIVETPADALDTFHRSGLDALYFADEQILVTRREKSAP